MRGKFVLAPNGDQLVSFCLSIVQGLSAFLGVFSEGFNCIAKYGTELDTVHELPN